MAQKQLEKHNFKLKTTKQLNNILKPKKKFVKI